jgi:hypothetical protein
MKNLFPVWPSSLTLKGAAVALGLLAGPTAHAQATNLYALGTTTQAYLGIPAGTQVISLLNPANLANTSALLVDNSTKQITGIAAGQKLVAIDVRPTTGQLYALGYNSSATTANTQLYLLDYNTGVLTAVGAAITLNLADDNRANTQGIVPNIGFDFNPRVDRIRVVAPNRTNYRLNPNTGGLAATDTQLTYVTGNNVGHDPYIGTAAYTNSALGAAGATLYDIDETSNNALLSIQNSPNEGVLSPQVSVTFAANGATTYSPLASPTVGLDLDIYYDRSTKRNVAYLVEVASSAADRFSSNLYTMELSSGRATGKNIFGGISLYISNIAAAINPPKTWNGSISNAWLNPSNWTPTGVPTATDAVYIPGPSSTVQFQPTVADTREAFSIALGVGAVLTTADGGLLNVYGDFLNNDGTLAGSGSGTVALVGTTQQEIGGPSLSNFRNLSVGAAGAFTSAAVAVEQALSVTGDLTIDNAQNFTLLSSPTTGVAYVVNNGGVVKGTATVRRYIDTSINSGFGYRHYSAPVTNTTVGDLATSTFTPVFNAAYNTSAAPRTTVPYPTVYGYNQAQYESSPAITDTPEFDKGYYSPASGSDAWVPGTGYTVNLNGSELVDFRGTLATGNFSTPPQGRSTKAKAGWQLLGNPYPSSLDWNLVAASGLSGIENALYVFKSTGQYSGSYASYVNGQGTNGGTNVVPVAQGFFVRTSAGAMGSINFTNAQRITGTAPFQRTAADTRPQLLLELSNGTATSQTDVYFENGATTAFDKAYDATALPFLNGLVLATQAGTEVLAINGQPALTGAVTVPLQVAVATAGTFTLRAATLSNLPAGYHAYLRDAVLNTYTDLATTPSVVLSLTTTPADGRYALLFTSALPLATAPVALAALANVYPSPAHGTATLLLPQALRGTGSSTVQLLNSLGQVVLTRTLAAGGPDSIELPLVGLSAGIYVVRVTTAAGLVAKRLVIR